MHVDAGHDLCFEQSTDEGEGSTWFQLAGIEACLSMAYKIRVQWKKEMLLTLVDNIS